MKNLCVLFLIVVITQCANTSRRDCGCKSVKITYDNGAVLRVIAPKTEDLKKWSKDCQAHGLDTLIISDEIAIRELCRQIDRIDTCKGRHLPLRITKEIALDDIYTTTVSFQPKDISAKLLLSIEKGNGEVDTLYLDGCPESPMRFNDFILPVDTVIWNRVNRILKSN